ncbi:cation:proton antiporter domain-containing protein, partial [Streptomyces anulatus]|uniref:cation:proton antiporter domain-containing protein n=1 Tax=Streptomyces anulatus TaxID=1892 RepID=UPI0036CBB450
MPTLLEVTTHLFLQVAVILIAYRVFVLIFRRLGQAQVVAMMVAGFALGPSVLGWVAPSVQEWIFPTELVVEGIAVTHPNLTAIYVIGQLGLVLYMFMVGASFKLDILRSHSRQATATSAAGVVVPLVLGGVTGWLLVDAGGFFTAMVESWLGGLFLAAAVAI